MSIRWKIVLVVVPLLTVTILLVGFSSAFAARSGITRVAIDALGFKAQELQKYADNQWDLLVTNDLADNPDYITVTRRAVQSYARTLLRADSELILAVDRSGAIVMTTAEGIMLSTAERADLAERAAARREGWQDVRIAGVDRVTQAFAFPPFGWFVLVTDTRENFFAEVEQITTRTYYILGAATTVALALLLAFASILTGPLSRMVTAMLDITQTNDLSRRVRVEYRDEIGAMARTFNRMLAKLEGADRQIRGFALRAVIAQRNERKIRNIFQRYVPKDVIDTIFANPEAALVGKEVVLPILFSDIRSFTTISEKFMPDELVVSLNKYFERLVDIIVAHGGIVDKYIGDAIMAFFGAPVRHDDDALQAVRAGLEMQEALRDFNARHVAEGKPEFKTGMGIHYGLVTVGNIGTEKKMDYTVIGDSVNYCSRLEGLTKDYHQGLIFSKSVYRKVKEWLPCRFIDFVQVKGKTTGEAVYTATLILTESEKVGWKAYHEGIRLFYKRMFKQSIPYFAKALEYLPADHMSGEFIRRARAFVKSPPPADWNGVIVRTSK
ncbi:MAG: adenylate/guanylate cyclase domain-containing protein [Spirochaetaceae bacterium]|nr:MAG: adenylate/guanylate cyclase domain-containing protein [Spirochaetaceae bacterium]